MKRKVRDLITLRTHTHGWIQHDSPNTYKYQHDAAPQSTPKEKTAAKTWARSFLHKTMAKVKSLQKTVQKQLTPLIILRRTADPERYRFKKDCQREKCNEKNWCGKSMDTPGEISRNKRKKKFKNLISDVFFDEESNESTYGALASGSRTLLQNINAYGHYDGRTPSVKKPEKRSRSSPPSTSTEKVVKMSRTDQKITLPADGEGAPAWFRAYEKRLNGTLGEIKGRIDSLEARFGALDTRVEEIARQQGEQKGLIAENTREIRELDQRISSEITDLRGHLTNNLNEINTLRADLNATSRPVSAAHLDLLSSADLCEVRIAGIPSAIETDSVTTAELVLEALQLNRLALLILKVRSWLPQTQASVDAATASTSTGVTRRTMVVRLASAGARDVLLVAAPRLRLPPIGPIFGIEHDGPDRLHMSAILPGPLYGIYKKCQTASRALKYLPPIVRGLRIYMRQSRKSSLISIDGEADLAKLKPHTS
ncbi:unnamed protein product [Trichogramma brassicae]|uniref:Uncharacterized protein n=1 Tax=Trichogramma brassicae TaxID=86971 RepID=A0A6H5I8H6_9HYME|nr:unnamed protein product [Trichogramma brassicae]